MYHYIDRPLPQLDHTSQFFIWAMRKWVGANMQKRCVCGSIGPVFLKWGMIDALPDFCMAMAHMNEGARQQLVFGQAGCGSVHEIEAILLSVQDSVLAGEIAAARTIAGGLIKEQSLKSYMIAMQRYCDHVTTSPLHISRLSRPHLPNRVENQK